MGFGLGPETLNKQVAVDQRALGTHGDSLTISLGKWIVHSSVCGSWLWYPSKIFTCLGYLPSIITVASSNIR